MQWNPTEYPAKTAYKWFAKGHDSRWSFASYRSARIGDEVYLRRSGKDRPGIVLRGTITRFTKPMETWKGGAIRPAVAFNINALAGINDEPLIGDAELLKIPGQDWRNESSGIGIKPGPLAALRQLMVHDRREQIEAALAGLSNVEQIALLSEMLVERAAVLKQH
jgi:hypothetical protein